MKANCRPVQTNSPLGAPAGEEGPLRLSSPLMLGLLASGGAQGQGGLFRQGKLHHGGQVQLATAGHKGGGDLLPHHCALWSATGGQGEGCGAAIYPQGLSEGEVEGAATQEGLAGL